jgi:hypothetical protein
MSRRTQKYLLPLPDDVISLTSTEFKWTTSQGFCLAV